MTKINFLEKQKKLGTIQEDETYKIMKDKILVIKKKNSVWKKRKSRSFKNQ